MGLLILIVCICDSPIVVISLRDAVLNSPNTPHCVIVKHIKTMQWKLSNTSEAIEVINLSFV